ncbi:hypothetical protein KC19_8G021400 [Ceratodon purpureus]|uniref:Uncharacterized protein n=1 Tax=Ceratodon purpureus TaxID=3225 RepID=A0A8T0GUC1_CERPU|nr:hypothetical protein KC19_8G021400 [Ceratodon purpureus]
MEARIRRVGGGFPGYDGPALPRAMRSQRGRGGDAAKRQANNLTRTGVFDLLATVAGQILQDAGSEDPNKTKQTHQEASKDKPQSDLDSQITSLESVKDFTSVDKPQPAGKPTVNADGFTDVCMIKDISVQASNDLETVSCAVRTPSQEEKRKVFVKDVLVDEGNGAPVHMNVSPLEDLTTLPLCESDMSTTRAGPSPASPSYEVKEMLPVSEACGGSTEVEQYPAEKIYETLTAEESASEMTQEVVKQAVLEIVEETPCVKMVEAAAIASETSSDSDKASCKLLEKSENMILCAKSLDEAEDGSVLVQGSPYQPSKNSLNSTPEIHMQCKMSESGEYGESAELIGGTEVVGDETASMEIEEKNVLGSRKNQPAAASSATFRAAALGLAQGRSTRPMVKRVMSRMDGKFYKREHVYRSSQRLHPETMTKKLDSYSKSLKVRRAVKVAKRNHVAGTTRTKRQHTEMESTDSGSSEDSRYGKKMFFSGIAAFTRQRTTRGLQNKRKKMVDGSSKTTPDLHLDTSDLMELEYECVAGEPPAAAAKLRSAKAASVASSPTARSAKLVSKKSLEPHVKLSIKSFTVPELFVDLPESASVASLKRAVMDAAMNLLGGGLRVRVLMQGKKVPDEAATLSQIGISRSAKPESLGFMLEPSPVLTSASATAEDPLLVLSRAANQPAPRYPVYGVPGLSGVGDGGVRCPMKGRSNKSSGVVVDPDPSYVPPSMSSDQEDFVDEKRNGVAFSATPEESVKGCNVTKTNKHMSERMVISPHPTRVAAAGALAAIRAQADASRRARNEVDSPSPAPSSSHDSIVAGSGAIILHPGLGTGDNVPGMALVPMRSKISRALDNGKRRVRRPFSVSEVEALVHAVEKLGTGRWRDVKLRAFEQAKHRTYVDLKDKWKTLVHTARIAPHQRRGEPVPQELLERVTRAHAYWTEHAAKQQADLDF